MGDDAFVVISHDCDLAADYEKEPSVEVVKVRRLKEGEDASQLFGKNPRLLQMVVSLEGQTAILEFLPSNKTSVPKLSLFERQPQGVSFLNPDQLTQLRTWLASRYRRHALPNQLVECLRPLFSKLEERAKKKAGGVIATFLSYTPESEIDNAEEKYEVAFAVVFDGESSDGEANAKSIAAALERAFEKIEGVELLEMDVYSDTEFTLRDTRMMTELSYEYLSFRGEHNLFTERQQAAPSVPAAPYNVGG